MNKHFFDELQKIAGIGSALTNTAILVGKYPKATLGIIGGSALGIGALNIANKLHGAYVMQNEMRKRGLMKQQRDLLKQLVSQRVKENKSDPRAVTLNHLVRT